MTQESDIVRRLLIAFVLLVLIVGESMAQSPEEPPQAPEGTSYRNLDRYFLTASLIPGSIGRTTSTTGSV